MITPKYDIDNKGNIVISLLTEKIPGSKSISKIFDAKTEALKSFGIGESVTKKGFLKLNALKKLKEEQGFNLPQMQNYMNSERKAGIEGSVRISKYIQQTYPVSVKLVQKIYNYVLNKLLEFVPEDTGKLARSIEFNSSYDENTIRVGNNGDPSVKYWEYLEQGFYSIGTGKMIQKSHPFSNTWKAKSERLSRGAGKPTEVIPPLKSTLLLSITQIESWVAEENGA